MKSLVWLGTMCLLSMSILSLAQTDATDLFQQAESTQALDTARLLYERSISIAAQQGDFHLADSILFALGKRFVGAGELISANATATRGLASGRKSFRSAFFNLKGVSFHHQNQLDSALTYYLQAVALLEAQNDTLKAATIRYNIGNIFLSYRDWEQADFHFQNMLNAIRSSGDSTYLAGVLASLSATQAELGNDEASRAYAAEALQVSEVRNDALGRMLALRQLGLLSIDSATIDTALYYLKEADKMAQLIGHPYYKALIKMNLSEAYQEAGDSKAAIAAGLTALEHPGSTEFATHLAVIYDVLSQAYGALGEYQNAFKFLRLKNEIRDGEIDEENKRVVNELLVKYETEKKDRQIAEQDLEIAKVERKTAIYFAIAVAAILIILFLIYLIFQNRKLSRARLGALEQRREREVLSAIVKGEELERRRMSEVLHDSLSNALFSCKLSLSSIKTHDEQVKYKLQDNVLLLDRVRDEARRMSHNLMPIDLEKNSLPNAISDYVSRVDEYAEGTEVIFQAFGRQEYQVSQSENLLLFRAVQELTGNALRYANATEINVQLFYSQESLRLSIEDDGKGAKEELLDSGQGLRSLKDRLAIIGGEMMIETGLSKGTLVNISLSR